MKLLSKLTPAETLLIKDGGASELKSLMKFTFMDLLLKKVLKIEDVSKKPHPRDKARRYTYVVSGKNFSKYTPKNHELIFLTTFQKSPSLQVLFKNYVRMVYDSAKRKSSYKTQVKNSPETCRYFKQSFLLNLFRINSLNNIGITIQKELTEYLIEIDNDINHLLTEDKQKGLELLLHIGGNVFLLKNLDFQLLKTIDKALINKHKDVNGDTYDSYCYWWIDFNDNDNSFESHFDSFDETISSFESEFDSSNSSDSSGWSSCDSSCSSCGGCD